MKLIINTSLELTNTAIKAEDLKLLITQRETLVPGEEHAHAALLLDIITYQMEERALFNISPN
jgi:hypothetical protein